MTGTLINAAAVIIGSLIGLLFHARLPQRYTDILFQAIGLFTIVLGISMALKAEVWILVILSLIIGAIIGEALRMDRFFDQLADRLGKYFGIGSGRFNEGLLTSFLLFCMGSMTVLGAIEEGLGGKPELFYIKSLMDGISSIALASGMGIGVLFSVVPLFLYQAGLTVLAAQFGSFMPELMITGISATGGVILVGLGLNLLKITQLRILNLLPSLVVLVLVTFLYLAF
ncbi:MAG: DUF554 domain-containing protein [Bacteroidales bacterium]|nr:DUF554 domain-containing protein [Bacteroidales bacterium]